MKRVSYLLISVLVIWLDNEILVAQSSQTYFAQLAIGGGYSTVFTLLNTGNNALTGNLILTGQDGKPLRASMTDGKTSVTDSIFPVTIQPGGTIFVTASSVNNTDPTIAGWASVSSSGGSLAGVATFQLTGSNGALQTIAGVLSSAPVSVATIPVDDDVNANHFTGYAIPNTGNGAITITINELSGDGSTFTVLNSLNIDPGKQVASFFFQDPKANQKFRGSAVFIGQNGATFSIVGLAQNQGLFTAIPVIPAGVQTPSCVPPTITTQPQNQSITSGQSVTLNVVASGTAPLSYQWYRGSKGDTSSPISGATISIYLTPVLTSTSYYWVRVSNSCASVDSSTATVTVTGTPLFTDQNLSIIATVTLEGTPVNTSISIVWGGLTAAITGNDVNFVISLTMGFNESTFVGNTISFGSIWTYSCTYSNSSRGIAGVEPITSGSMTLSIEKAAVGANVSGSLTFTTTKRTLQSNITGTLMGIQ